MDTSTIPVAESWEQVAVIVAFLTYFVARDVVSSRKIKTVHDTLTKPNSGSHVYDKLKELTEGQATLLTRQDELEEKFKNHQHKQDNNRKKRVYV